MFSQLTQKLSHAFYHLRGRPQLNEKNIESTLANVEKALISSDVAVSVVKTVIGQVREKARSQSAPIKLSPEQFLIKLVHDELVSSMGASNVPLNFHARPPAVFLLAGLQGAGKTTTVIKLAHHITQREKKSVMVVSTDTQRPAAMHQLAVLADQAGVPCFPSSPEQQPTEIVQQALTEARKRSIEVLIIDTAGRLHIDEVMMQEIDRLHQLVDPTETLFVVDSMTGQDAVHASEAFHEALPLTGVILTKADGDARGGAALSVRAVTGKPIKFIGVGEKIEDLERFHPERIASSILGMGDVMTLIEQAQEKIDKVEAEKMAKKLKKGKGFNFVDLRSQFKQLEKMGGLSNVLKRMPSMPGMGNLFKMAQKKVDDKAIKHMIAMIDSMTQEERERPTILNPSRIQRIAKGSGQSVSAVRQLIKQYEKMQKMMKYLKGGGGLGAGLKDLLG